VYRMTDPEKRLADIILDPFASVNRLPDVLDRDAGAAPASPASPALPVPSAPPPSGDKLPDGGFADATRAYEAQLLRQALETCRFNQAEAARRLGLSYYQFRHHLRVHGMLPGTPGKGESADAA